LLGGARPGRRARRPVRSALAGADVLSVRSTIRGPPPSRGPAT